MRRFEPNDIFSLTLNSRNKVYLGFTAVCMYVSSSRNTSRTLMKRSENGQQKQACENYYLSFQNLAIYFPIYPFGNETIMKVITEVKVLGKNHDGIVMKRKFVINNNIIKIIP